MGEKLVSHKSHLVGLKNVKTPLLVVWVNRIFQTDLSELLVGVVISLGTECWGYNSNIYRYRDAYT